MAKLEGDKTRPLGSKYSTALCALAKILPRQPCVPSFVKSKMVRPLQTYFLLFQQISFVLVYIHPGNARVSPQVLASGRTSTIHPGIFGGRTLCADMSLRNVSHVSTASRDELESEKFRDELYHLIEIESGQSGC